MRFIKDEEFIRGNCPMTKEEIRILSIAKLELDEDSNVLDVGAGTGSISIQAAKICSKGKVIGIEKNEDALEVIYKNKEKFQTNNFEIIEGEAMEKLNEINQSFDAVFIGGSGGNLSEIINISLEKLKPQGRIVLNFITIDNLYIALNTLKELGVETECNQIGVSRTKGRTHMLLANNPIFIISGRK
ncbi:precorrin-6Y C5,15-methyltransferase (decarboxylating) subunit CbiT [Clostridium sediminicola]|uniref:precorrin-6Y C5,15-methyltransferase (decarboxylating) subunit CbiT n=1 Tax=Clostridium sediminicola TaxID=3114879 RepID=UPI0031F1F6A3